MENWDISVLPGMNILQSKVAERWYNPALICGVFYKGTKIFSHNIKS
jgi:hypothetical protein